VVVTFCPGKRTYSAMGLVGRLFGYRLASMPCVDRSSSLERIQNWRQRITFVGLTGDWAIR
jgi:hypothetical protein